MYTLIRLSEFQGANPWAVIAIILWHLFNTTMSQLVATYVLISAAIMGIGAQITVHQLDKATAKQCITHDWPKTADEIHKDWCIDNGYSIN